MKRQTRFERIPLAEVPSELRRQALEEAVRVHIQRENTKDEPYHVQPRGDRRAPGTREGGF